MSATRKGGKMASGGEMDREVLVRNLADQMDSLARFHIQHRLGHTQAAAQLEEKIHRFINEHGINVTEEMDSIHKYYYWRFLT